MPAPLSEARTQRRRDHGSAQEVATSMRSTIRLGPARRSLRDGRLLLERWQAASLKRGWMVPSDWLVPQVENLLQAVVSKPRDVVETHYFEGLGRARGEAGVGLPESLTDLGALADALGTPALDPESAVALARGWSEASTYRTAETAVDPLTDLGTSAYLQLRLREVYEAVEYLGQHAGGQWVLVVIELRFGGGDELQDSVALIEVARSLRLLYGNGQSVVRLGPVRFAALVPQTAAVIEQVEILSDLVAEQFERLGIQQDRTGSALDWHAIDLPPTLGVALATVRRLSG